MAVPDGSSSPTTERLVDCVGSAHYEGFVAFLDAVGAGVAGVTYNAEGVVEILIEWPEGYQILSPRQAMRGN